MTSDCCKEDMPIVKCDQCGDEIYEGENALILDDLIVLLEHDMLYEPTFNQDDGSM